MEVGRGDPLDRGVHQVRGGEGDTDPRAFKSVAGDQVHGQRAQAEGESLRDIEERRSHASQ